MARPRTTAQYRSARRFQQPPPLFRWAKDNGYLDPPGDALVFGAGHLGEARALADLGWRVDALETPDSVSRRADLYDEFALQPGCRVITTLDRGRKDYRLIVVTHVLEFIEQPRERRMTLRQLGAQLAANGFLLLSLRGWADVNAARKRVQRGDGVMTGLGTWTRGYTVEEADQLVASAGLKVTASPRSKRSSTPEQVRLVCQRS
jgi:hypothetical protein